MLENAFTEIPWPWVKIRRGFAAAVSILPMAKNAHVLVNGNSERFIVGTGMRMRWRGGMFFGGVENLVGGVALMIGRINCQRPVR